MNADSNLRLIRAVDKKRMAGCSADGSGVYVDVFEEGERQAAHHGSDNVVPSQIDKAIDRPDTETPGINVFDKSAACGRRLDEEAIVQTRAGFCEFGVFHENVTDTGRHLAPYRDYTPPRQQRSVLNDDILARLVVGHSIAIAAGFD